MTICVRINSLPQSNDEGAKEQKRAVLASLKRRGGVGQMFHLFFSKVEALFTGKMNEPNPAL